MNKTALILLLAAAGAAPATAQQITVILPDSAPQTEVIAEHGLIQVMASARSAADSGIVADTAAVANGKAVFTIDPQGPSRYIIPVGEDAIDLYADPSQQITVNVSTVEPLTYSVGGSALMEAVQQMRAATLPIETQFAEVKRSGNPDAQLMEDLIAQYSAVFSDYAKEHPGEPGVAFAVLQLDGENFLTAYDANAGVIETSILKPYLDSKRTRTERRVAQQKAQDALISGHAEAPAFTLKNLEGHDVSLAQFRGKWVVLDFWGSWCIWCIKGFPSLKEAYAKYSPELEVIGIDCRESEEAWKAGVAKYQLPWVNVYCPEGSTLTEQYQVQGFPTKVIVNPEGKIADITTGEDPSFFERLATLMGK